MTRSSRPIIFLDFDDVIVLNRPGQFGGYDVIAPNPPAELWSSLFHVPAIETLVEALTEHGARVVITTSWLRFMRREAFERLFTMTGLEVLNASLHEAWEAPQGGGGTRAQAIDRWLADHHRGEPYVIADDELSGTGLRFSVHERQGRLVLCNVDVGLHRGHLAVIRAALTTSARKPSRVLFLDFDGVLHPAVLTRFDKPPAPHLDVQLFGWLPELASALHLHRDVAVIVYSKWRYATDLDEIRGLLGSLGNRFIGTAPMGAGPVCILSWLDMNPPLTGYRILTAELTDFPVPPPRELILCDPRTGVASPAIVAAIRQWLEE